MSCRRRTVTYSYRQLFSSFARSRQRKGSGRTIPERHKTGRQRAACRPVLSSRATAHRLVRLSGRGSRWPESGDCSGLTGSPKTAGQGRAAGPGHRPHPRRRLDHRAPRPVEPAVLRRAAREELRCIRQLAGSVRGAGGVVHRDRRLRALLQPDATDFAGDGGSPNGFLATGSRAAPTTCSRSSHRAWRTPNSASRTTSVSSPP